MLLKRRSGSFSRQRLITLSRRRDAFAVAPPDRERSIGRPDGSARRIADMTSSAVPPANAARPETISQSTHPNEKMSLRGSASSPRTCSGAMYCGVPAITPRRVDPACSAAGIPDSDSRDVGWNRASPKSSSFDCGSPSRPELSFTSMMLAGFRSLCTMPSACAASSASAI